MCFQTGNDNSCLWLILIVILLCCCCGNQGSAGCSHDCGCRNNCCGDPCGCC